METISEDGYFPGWINNIYKNKKGESKCDAIILPVMQILNYQHQHRATLSA